jgi:hypothetical protein
MPTNTQYNPQKTSEFTKDNLQFSGQAIYFECPPSSDQHTDLQLTEDYLLTGGRLLVKGGNLEDTVFIQIVHPIYGVVNEFISGYRVASDTELQINLSLDYPAKLPAGLSIRCKYVSNAETGTRKIALNMFLHKVLF